MKKQLFKYLALSLSAALLLSLLSSCGGGGGGGTAQATPNAEVTQEPEESSEPQGATTYESADAIPMGQASGFVIDLPVGYHYDDAWSCYQSADNAVRIWVTDANFYETENEFRSLLEDHEGALKKVELDGVLPAWLYEDPAGFYGAETHYCIGLGDYYEGKSGCHLIVSNESGDMASTQTQVILDALKTIRREGEKAGERAAEVAAANADPYESLLINFTPGETAAMSTFISGGRYAADGDTMFGQAYDSNGTVELVRFDLVKNGAFAEPASHVVLDHGIVPSYVTLHGDDVYYIRDGKGVYKVSRDGGTPECVVPDAADYLQIRGDKLYYCNSAYTFCQAKLDGSDAAPVLEKEIYYPYLVNDNWLIYQDDADDESLHLRHVRSGEDITLCPTPTYSPVIFGTDLYCVTSANGDKTLAKIDMTYTPDSPGNFAIEYGEVPESADITISASGYLYYGSENGLYIDRWREATNPEAKFQLAYHYIGEDYEIYWQYNDEGQVTALYVTLIASGGSNSLPRFD